MPTRSIAYLATSALGFAVAVPLALGLWNGAADPCGSETIKAQSTGPFDLIFEDGTQTSFAPKSRPTLLYFGYTYCPDICPVDLSRNAGAVQILADKNVSLEFVFVTVDPQRDTAKTMSDYTDLLHPDLSGYTGAHDQIRTIADAFGVYAVRADGHPTDYLMDHSGLTYFWRQGREKVEIFRNDLSSSQLADDIMCLLSV